MALLSLHAGTAQAGTYGAVSWATRQMLTGQVGVLGQAVRVPSSLFAKSPCQLIYLGNPDWSTSQVFVDFGSASPATGCRQQAFLTYVDGYNDPRGITGVGSKADIPWSTLVTYPANMQPPANAGGGSPGSADSGSNTDTGAASSAVPPSAPPSSSQPPPDGDSATPPPPTSNSRRRHLRAKLSYIDVPLDRMNFGVGYDALRDRGDALMELIESEDEGIIPGVGGPLSKPILAASWFQERSAIPDDPRVYLDYVKRRQALQANGTDVDPDETVLAGLVSGPLSAYAPLPSECAAVLNSRRRDAVRVSGSAADAGTGLGFRLRRGADAAAGALGGNATADADADLWNPLSSPGMQDSCFVTQLVLVIYNDCPIAAPASGIASSSSDSSSGNSSSGNSSSGGSSSQGLGVPGDCSRAPDVESELACVLRQSALMQAADMPYVPTDADVQIVVRHYSYNRCYRVTAQRLGQTGNHLIYFSGGLILLLSIILLTPTIFRLFISFPCRCIAYGLRKLFRRRRVTGLPLQGGLHSYKAPGDAGCYRWPLVRQLLAARKHLLYAMCTIHSADGQYRALQVSVTSSVALMICMMSFPPTIKPFLEYYMPPLAFRIERESGLPMSSVVYFLTILAVSLFLGFTGYLAMLANYNRPRNKYYRTQCILSVLFMLILDALVLMQVYCILLYWGQLLPRWPWLPMTVFQLGNLVVSNALLVVTLLSREDRRLAHRRREYMALMEELRDREINLALVRRARAKAQAAQAAAAAQAAGDCNSNPNSNSNGGGGGGGGGALPDPPATSLSSSSPSLRRRAMLAASGQAGGLASSLPQVEPQEAAAAAAAASSSPSWQWGVGRVRMGAGVAAAASAEFDDLAAVVGSDERAATAAAATPRPVAESYEVGAVGAAAAVGAADPSSSDDACDVRKDLSSSSAAAAAAAARGDLSGSAIGRVVSGGSASAGFTKLRSLRRRWRERREGGWLHNQWRKWARPLSEDAAFRFPSWLLAALVVSAYMLVFTYARAMTWAQVVQDCIADPAECLNANLARYFVFTTRLLGRDWQVRVRDTLDGLAASQGSFRAMMDGALAGNDTIPGLSGTVDAVAANLSDAVTGAAAAQLRAALSSDLAGLVAGLLNDTIGPQAAALVPANQTAALQARLADAVTARVAALNLSAAAEPVAMGVQASMLRALNVSMTPLFTAVTATSNVLSVSIKVTNNLGNWKQDLEKRFFWCSLAGFTLGLLLGLSSLVTTAIAFRTAARKLRLARIAARVFTEGDEDGGVGGDGGGAGGPRKWTVSNLQSVFDEQDSIVRRSEATSIALVVFFFGVLLSTAIVQLYAVGVTLSIALALVTHPWTWTWLLPRYYMWLVAIIIGIVLNKVVLLSYVGDTWLSNGDRIYRPAAWLAFLVIASATNLVIGLLLALYRIALLLLTTIFALGKLDVTLFTMLANLDLPHRTFLAGLHLQESMSDFHDPIHLPGPRGRAHRRWRKLREALAKHKIANLRQLAGDSHLVGGGKVVEEDADQVLVVMPEPSAVLSVEYGAHGVAGAQPPPPPPFAPADTLQR